MLEEMSAFKKDDTWELVLLFFNKGVVSYKPVFIVNQKTYGIVDRYKVRLAVRGFMQTYGIDYEQTFALVDKMNTIE